MTLVLSTFFTAIASALLPFLNMEITLGVIAERTNLGPDSIKALYLALAAGAGQTVGKIIWYEAAKLSWDSPWVQKKVTNEKWRRAYDKWQQRIDGRPWFAGAIMFCAAFTGIPPLLVLAMLAGTLKMPLWVFIPTVFVGRVMRFWLILAGVGTLFD